MMGIRVAIILALQTAALVGMIATKQYALETGRQILLETRVVDPRSLFRGDYVRLSYTISSLDVATLEGDKSYQPGDQIFVSLEQQGKYWQAVATHHGQPSANGARVVIKGEVVRMYSTYTLVSVKYFIEDYFVPEGEGRALEDLDSSRIDIRVAVDRHGDAVIVALLVDGEPRHAAPLF